MRERFLYGRVWGFIAQKGGRQVRFSSEDGCTVWLDYARVTLEEIYGAERFCCSLERFDLQGAREDQAGRDQSANGIEQRKQQVFRITKWRYLAKTLVI